MDEIDLAIRVLVLGPLLFFFRESRVGLQWEPLRPLAGLQHGTGQRATNGPFSFKPKLSFLIPKKKVLSII